MLFSTLPWFTMWFDYQSYGSKRDLRAIWCQIGVLFINPSRSAGSSGGEWVGRYFTRGILPKWPLGPLQISLGFASWDLERPSGPFGQYSPREISANSPSGMSKTCPRAIWPKSPSGGLGGFVANHPSTPRRARRIYYKVIIRSDPENTICQWKWQIN